MSLGPGKYDHLATRLLMELKATGVVLIVHGGTLGSGFSVSMTSELIERMPEVLRRAADEMEQDTKKLKELRNQ